MPTDIRTALQHVTAVAEQLPQLTAGDHPAASYLPAHHTNGQPATTPHPTGDYGVIAVFRMMESWFEMRGILSGSPNVYQGAPRLSASQLRSYDAGKSA